ncbi:MAG: glutamate--cysteine ligase [Hyphomicrobiales bacterium]|nr:glutamate--cysteine ligase [Hyphomicrobiales bacterium]
MARDVSDSTPVSSRDDLVAWLEAGCKAPDAFRLGTEHEKFPFYLHDRSPVPYEGREGRGGVGALLSGVLEATGWEPIMDGEALIGLLDPKSGGAISLEPGGQFELSGAPLDNVHQTAGELQAHLELVNAIAARNGAAFLGLGMSPTWTRAQTPSMPKSRYRIMTQYMPTVGARGLDMMYRTSTVQVNVDFASEADMVRKLRVSLALQPIATILFANSPFTEGRPNGFLSARSEIWRDTDNQRSGMIPFVFEDGFGFERYVDWAVEVPMYFVKRGETYHDVAGADFRHLLDGKLDALPGERATMSDWANHLSTTFPEVRLKRYLEMRGADSGSSAHILALSAFFVGLLYDADSLAAAWDLAKGWSAQDRQRLRDDAPRLGFNAHVAGRSARDVARDALAISRAGLARRRRLDASGADEGRYLDVLDDRVARGRTAADDLLALYEGAWGRSVDPVFDACRL